MTEPLSREQVEELLMGLVQDKVDGVNVARLLEHDAMLRAKLEAVEQERGEWKGRHMELKRIIEVSSGQSAGFYGSMAGKLSNELNSLKRQLAAVTQARDEYKYRLQAWNDAHAERQAQP